ncbi:hypothetical protein [Sphingobacterium thalpophilum]|uniref:hypothetical protein n=1 Tax=Sphingobacterium thalpophilum TaxID=259 RepID=UPI0024A61E62|nr:hypothetical protein [Sphingobacterium thalpophilum]
MVKSVKFFQDETTAIAKNAIVSFIDLLLVYSQRFRHLSLEERWLQANIKFIKVFRIFSKIKFWH